MPLARVQPSIFRPGATRPQELRERRHARRGRPPQPVGERRDAGITADAEASGERLQIARPDRQPTGEQALADVGRLLGSQAHGRVAECEPGDDGLGKPVGRGARRGQQPSQLGPRPRRVRDEPRPGREAGRIGEDLQRDVRRRSLGHHGLLDLRERGTDRERAQPSRLVRGRPCGLVLAPRALGERAVRDEAEQARAPGRGRAAAHPSGGPSRPHHASGRPAVCRRIVSRGSRAARAAARASAPAMPR